MTVSTYCSLRDCGTWDRQDPRLPGTVLGLVQCLGTSNSLLLKYKAGKNKEGEDELFYNKLVVIRLCLDQCSVI